MSKTKGLDFEKATEEANKSGYPPGEGYQAWEKPFRASLQAQHQTLLDAAIAEARREERGAVTSQWQALLDAEKVSSDSRVLLLRLDYALVVAAVREWRRIRLAVATPGATEKLMAEYLEAQETLAALPLPLEAE